ncbi:helix-turn-helix domain-containing protein [Flavobacterium sp. AC]|uniref:Helix-turn-helix domain-containing protein n=1 Tax=Flavobacterium azizsancarii TaxID=2961580 RepID=A0ABT4W9B6_9FLAO|nr:helix-turn-helix transcriptional regulator [Flavobacterium azizsancarii]MDA6069140.1 helix-turn-helix domain-containing protein [Flavobacterium azizsancarii]
MKLNKRIRALRIEKKLSQSYIAHELSLEQSQYCRREKGEIHFSPDEIVKISKLLDTNIALLFGEETNKSNNLDQESIKYVTVPKLFIDQYELRIKEKDDLIKLLRGESDKI